MELGGGNCEFISPVDEIEPDRLLLLLPLLPDNNPSHAEAYIELEYECLLLLLLFLCFVCCVVIESISSGSDEVVPPPPPPVEE